MTEFGFRTTYRYYCEDEEKWVTEERKENSTPTNCCNSEKHTIKNGSVSVVGRNLNLSQMKVKSDVYDKCDISYVDGFNHIQCIEKLSGRVKVLEELLFKLGQLKFVG